MHKLAAEIRERRDALAAQYAQRLREIDEYAGLSKQTRQEIAVEDLDLIATCLASDDPSPFVDFTHARAGERVAQGFTTEPLMQALSAIEKTLFPLISQVAQAKFLWGILSGARQGVAQQAAHGLRQSEKAFREFVDRLTVGIFRTTLDGQILEANPSFLRIVGYDSIEAINKVGVPALYQRPAERQRLLTLLEHGPVSGFETRFQRPDGQIVSVSINVRVAQVGDDRFLEGSLEDITERKRLEQQLRQSEDKFRQLVNRALVGIFRTALDGEVVEANPAALETLRLESIEQVNEIGLLNMYVDVDDRRRLLERTQQGPVSGFETRLRRADGQVIHVSVGAHMVYDEEGNPQFVEGTLEDITERKLVQKALEEQRSFLRQIIDTLPGFVFVKDREGRYVLANEALARTYGTTATDIIGKTDADFNVDQAERFQQDDLQVMDSLQEKLIPEERMEDEEGNVRWVQTIKRPLVDQDGEAHYVLGLVTDITERKRIEYELEEQQAFLRQVIDINPNFIFVRDREGRFILANKATAAGYGVSVEELIGKTDADFNPNEEQVSRAHQDDLQVMDSLQEKRVSESAITDPDGNVRWLQTIKRPLVDEDGVARRVLGVSSDITEQKQLREQLATLLERRAEQVRTGTEIAQEIAAAPALDELFRRVVTLIKERFDYYHAQLFRYEPALNAVVLVTGYGEVGEQMLQEGYRPKMGSGVVGAAVTTGEPVLMSDVEHSPNWIPNPYLPDAQGELAVPIKLRDQVLGILDVHSDEAGALTEDDQILLEGLCGQIAIAIEDTRLRQEMAESLQELRSMYRALGREGWESFRATGQLPDGYLYDRDTLQAATDLWSEEIAQAAERQELVAPADDEPGAMAVAPMQVHQEVVGVMGVYDDPEYPLSTDDLALIQAVSEQTALALESARLFEEARSRAEDLSMHFQVSQQLASAFLQPDEIGEIVASHLTRVGNLECSLSLIEDDGDTLKILADFHVEDDSGQLRRDSQDIKEFKLSQYPATAQVVETMEPLVVQADDPQADPAELAYMREHGVETLLIVPLTVKGEAIGVMEIEWWEKQSITPERLNLMVTLASQAAVALENASLFEEARARAEEQTVLSEMGRALSEALETQAILENVYQYTTRLMDTNNFYVALYNPELDEVTFPLATEGGERVQWRPRKMGQGLTEHIIHTREPVLVQEGVDQWLQAQGIDLIGPVAKSWLGVPMRVGRRVLGVIAVQSLTEPQAYTEHHLDLLSAAATQAAIAFQNARLFQEAQARAQREQQLREITTRLRTPPNIDGVLRVLAQELGQTLGRRTFVRLGKQAESEAGETPPAQPGSSRDNGGRQ